VWVPTAEWTNGNNLRRCPGIWARQIEMTTNLMTDEEDWLSTQHYSATRVTKQDMVPWVHHVRPEQKKEKDVPNQKKEQKRTDKKGTGTKISNKCKRAMQQGDTKPKTFSLLIFLSGMFSYYLAAAA
jgi:hypothetical protein